MFYKTMDLIICFYVQGDEPSESGDQKETASGSAAASSDAADSTSGLSEDFMSPLITILYHWFQVMRCRIWNLRSYLTDPLVKDDHQYSLETRSAGLGALLDNMEDNDHIKLDNIDI